MTRAGADLRRRPGCRPGREAALFAVAAAVSGGAVGAACNDNNPTYFSGGAALQVDGTGTAAVANPPFQLAFRAPTNDEENQRRALGDKLGYEVPSLREDRIHIEMKYTVTNLGDRAGTFSLRLDGADEFTRYDEDDVALAFTAANQDAVSFGLIQPTPQTVAPGQSYQGTLREDDFHEASLDLDAMGRWMGSFGSLLINRSEVNPVGLELVNPSPPAPADASGWQHLVRPALWELTPRFNADQPMTFEFLVRVRDDDGRLWKSGEAQFMPDPTVYMPVVVARM